MRLIAKLRTSLNLRLTWVDWAVSLRVATTQLDILVANVEKWKNVLVKSGRMFLLTGLKIRAFAPQHPPFSAFPVVPLPVPCIFQPFSATSAVEFRCTIRQGPQTRLEVSILLLATSVSSVKTSTLSPQCTTSGQLSPRFWPQVPLHGSNDSLSKITRYRRKESALVLDRTDSCEIWRYKVAYTLMWQGSAPSVQPPRDVPAPSTLTPATPAPIKPRPHHFTHVSKYLNKTRSAAVTVIEPVSGPRRT